jgi:hypothetical protein
MSSFFSFLVRKEFCPACISCRSFCAEATPTVSISISIAKMVIRIAAGRQGTSSRDDMQGKLRVPLEMANPPTPRTAKIPARHLRATSALSPEADIAERYHHVVPKSDIPHCRKSAFIRSLRRRWKMRRVSSATLRLANSPLLYGRPRSLDPIW